MIFMAVCGVWAENAWRFPLLFRFEPKLFLLLLLLPPPSPLETY